ncbi:hypothetical protein [Acetobacterium wieringae]|uniref:hypothetical protein n=1 Tax=Acetobacterium wieringae TaxID=52694 RepID=UPI0026EFE060|nr:hypothetical protein [Acetobacterium wieringae]
MKLHAIYKYQLADHRNAVLIFSAIMLAVMALVPMQISFSSDILTTNQSGQIAGLDIAPAVFLFVCGLNAFKENFLFALQNGISRKSLFVNRLFVTVTLAVMMTLFSLLLLTLGKLIESPASGIAYSSLLSMIYQSTGAAPFSIPFEYLISFLFLTVLFIAAQALGYLITVAFYRMDKKQKISYIVGFYIIVFVVLPLIDMFISGQISTFLLKFLDMVMGISAHNPFIGVFSLLIFSIIATGLTWILIRKIGIKN